MLTKQNIQDMDPYKFEELISDIWSKKGFKTKVRSKSKDRGVDVVAEIVKTGHKEVIQAKCYSGENKVGSQEVREYATLYQQIPTANSVVIVTASEFTADAKRLAGDLNVEIYDGDQITEQINKYGVKLGIKKSSDERAIGSTKSVSVQEKRLTSEIIEDADEALDEFFEAVKSGELKDVDYSGGMPRLSIECSNKLSELKTEIDMSAAKIKDNKEIIVGVAGENSTNNFLRVLNSASSVCEEIKDLDRHWRDSSSGGKSMSERKKDRNKIDIGKKLEDFNNSLDRFNYIKFMYTFDII
jgi:predicted RecB family endonuclease